MDRMGQRSLPGYVANGHGAFSGTPSYAANQPSPIQVFADVSCLARQRRFEPLESCQSNAALTAKEAAFEHAPHLGERPRHNRGFIRLGIELQSGADHAVVFHFAHHQHRAALQQASFPMTCGIPCSGLKQRLGGVREHLSVAVSRLRALCPLA